MLCSTSHDLWPLLEGNVVIYLSADGRGEVLWQTELQEAATESWHHCQNDKRKPHTCMQLHCIVPDDLLSSSCVRKNIADAHRKRRFPTWVCIPESFGIQQFRGGAQWVTCRCSVTTLAVAIHNHNSGKASWRFSQVHQIQAGTALPR